MASEVGGFKGAGALQKGAKKAVAVKYSSFKLALRMEKASLTATDTKKWMAFLCFICK